METIIPKHNNHLPTITETTISEKGKLVWRIFWDDHNTYSKEDWERLETIRERFFETHGFDDVVCEVKSIPRRNNAQANLRQRPNYQQQRDAALSIDNTTTTSPHNAMWIRNSLPDPEAFTT